MLHSPLPCVKENTKKAMMMVASLGGVRARSFNQVNSILMMNRRRAVYLPKQAYEFGADCWFIGASLLSLNPYPLL